MYRTILSVSRDIMKIEHNYWVMWCAAGRSKLQSFNTVSMATKLFGEKNEKIVPDQTERFVNTSTLLFKNDVVDVNTFERVCEETLDSLSEYFEELIESAPHLESADVSYGNGVLTVNFGKPYGVYVINRQSPNRQIWLSSPTSGPKRYDFVTNGNCWIYKHDGMTLHQLLQKEIPDIVKRKVDFTKCSYSKLN